MPKKLPNKQLAKGNFLTKDLAVPDAATSIDEGNEILRRITGLLGRRLKYDDAKEN